MGLELNVATISLLLILLTTAINAQTRVFDVRNYGAKPNIDITEAVARAWKDACAYPGSSKVVVPEAMYRVGNITFFGPCKSPIEFNVLGSIHSPGDPNYFKGDRWIAFQSIDYLIVSGTRYFDGEGETAWSRNGCSKNGYCAHLPISIRFDYVTNSIVRDISSYNSKQFHIHALGCQNLTFDHVTIKAPQNSPNTDGIHIGRSTKINVINSQISTRDDCVSIGDGSRDILIQGVNCGPGHGISIGSLGMYQNEQPVSGVRVIGCNLTNTSNGVRIKTWPDSYPGSASDILFENIIINNVDAPIIVDQGYCPWNVCKPEIPSKVKISNVSFKNIRGTSARKSAVVLVCSSSLPCENVELRDIDLRYNGKDGPATSRCVNVNPIIAGYQNPPPCTIRTVF